MLFIKGADWSGCLIAAVDHGYDLCIEACIEPDIFIGDKDSLQGKVSSGIRTVRLDKKKDVSDTFEAARILSEEFDKIYVVNGSGGRPDHYYFNMMMPLYFKTDIYLVSPQGTLFHRKPGKRWMLDLDKEETFSLLPVGRCRGITLEGCEYPLSSAEAESDSYTLSNISTGDTMLYYESGKLLIYREGIPRDMGKRQG